MASWGETLREYEASKRTPAWGTAERMPQVERVTRRGGSAGHGSPHRRSGFDPIACAPADPTVAREVRKAEEEQQRRLIGKGWERKVKEAGGRRHDIITGAEIEGIPNDSAAQSADRRRRDLRASRGASKAPYNILSNVAHGKGDNVPVPPTGFDQGSGQVPLRDPAKGGKMAKQLVREHDILSNEPFNREKAEFEETKRQLEAFRTVEEKITYDPIVGKYHDPDKDVAERVAESRKAMARSAVKVARQPKYVREGESQGFDITSGMERDPVVAGIVRRKEAAQLRAHAVGPRFESYVKRRDLEQQARREELSLNRVAHERSLEAVRHGRDIISNQPYFGVGARDPPGMRTRPRAEEKGIHNPHARAPAGAPSARRSAIDDVARGGAPGTATSQSRFAVSQRARYERQTARENAKSQRQLSQEIQQQQEQQQPQQAQQQPQAQQQRRKSSTGNVIPAHVPVAGVTAARAETPKTSGFSSRGHDDANQHRATPSVPPLRIGSNKKTEGDARAAPVAFKVAQPGAASSKPSVFDLKNQQEQQGGWE